jgi:hypothetical protein
VEDDLTAEVKGRDLVSGLPKTVSLTAEEVRVALEEPLRVIVETIKETLERTPPELAADVARRGILLAGGGSLLKGFDERVRVETKMSTYLAESPLTCVVMGSPLGEFDVSAPGDGRVGVRAATSAVVVAPPAGLGDGADRHRRAGREWTRVPAQALIDSGAHLGRS